MEDGKTKMQIKERIRRLERIKSSETHQPTRNDIQKIIESLENRLRQVDE